MAFRSLPARYAVGATIPLLARNDTSLKAPGEVERVSWAQRPPRQCEAVQGPSPYQAAPGRPLWGKNRQNGRPRQGPRTFVFPEAIRDAISRHRASFASGCAGLSRPPKSSRAGPELGLYSPVLQSGEAQEIFTDTQASAASAARPRLKFALAQYGRGFLGFRFFIAPLLRPLTSTRRICLNVSPSPDPRQSITFAI